MGEFRGNQHTENAYEDYSYDELVSDVKSLATKLEKTPTTREAMEADELPSLERIYDVAPGSWQDVLEDAGVGKTQVERYGPEEKPKMIHDLRRTHHKLSSQALTTRDYDKFGSYPTSVIKDYFGSWSRACHEAGIERGQKHGTRCTGPRDEQLDSKLELTAAETLDKNQLEYETHPSIPDSDWIGDFYLPENELWIEVDGYSEGDRPNAVSFEEKLEHYREHGLTVEVVTSEEELERCLRRRGILPA